MITPPKPGTPIQLRTGRGTKSNPYHWIPAIAVRHTPTRLFYRFPNDPPLTEAGPVRLDCEDSTWRRSTQ